ncbi:unnamed protein product [Peronospora belbahrii]|uniref:Glucosidase 2 subunit beta n=1 Tax=Peronospora belbahrii TaxID=622444 RepID=A0AAU9L6X9_9STRA|nr:unnamed protein product [Peronospora belbahrii]CAH0513212.1 unnamed protein product [Peronospora belbahrii]
MAHFLCSFLVLSLSLVSSTAQIRGVAPLDQIKYSSATFPCIISGKETNLSQDRVNDEYCDCDDGIDEPGTAACSYLLTSVFYCDNDGFFPENIHTSRVQDGICDCCDGSDEEIDGQVSCPNTCVVAAEKLREEAEQRLKMVQIGFEKRQVMINGEIAQCFEGMKESEKMTEKKLASLELLKDRVTVHKDREELKERKYRLEVARQKQVKYVDDDQVKQEPSAQDVSVAEEKETAEVWEFETLDAIQVADDNVPINTADDERALEVLESNWQTVKSRIVLPDGTKISLADYLRMNHNEKSTRTATEIADPLFNGASKGRKKIGLLALRAIGIIISPVRVLVEVLLYSPRVLWSVLSTPELAGPVIDKLPSFPSPSSSFWFRRLGEGSVYNIYNVFMWSAQVVWDTPVYAYHYLFPTLDDEVKLPLPESLRIVLREIESEIAMLEKDRNEKHETARMDYGPDRAYYALKSKCIEKRIEKYMYKFCAFGEVKQDQTSLGKWDDWNGEADYKSPSSGKLDYTSMRYSKGQQCYQGPARSVLVHLECGENDEILDVDEPSTCVYEMTVRSPLACTAQVFAEAQTDVAFWSQKQLR